MKVCYRIILLCLLYNQSAYPNGQYFNYKDFKVRPSLTIGDSLPRFVVDSVINSKMSSIKSHDFNDRLLIIDFWSTWCSGCVESMPKFDKLQKKFGDKIKILPVTSQSSSVVKEFWKKNVYTNSISLACVVADTIFSSYFKHRIIPHEVWIYKGHVIAITSSDYVDSSNIERVLSGTRIDWPIKNDYYNFDIKGKSLFQLDSDQVDADYTMIKYAAICSYKNGVNAVGLSGGRGIIRDSLKKTVRVYLLNHSIFAAYYTNWSASILNEMTSGTYQIQPNQVVWDVNDKSKYIFDSKKGYEQDWIIKNGICFESLNPDTGQSDEQIYRSTINDLNRLLHLNVRWENRYEKVIVLKRVKNPIQSKKLGGALTVDDLVSILSKSPNNPQIVDETRYSGTLFYSKIFDGNMTVEELLKQMGIEFLHEYRNTKKLVFSELGKPL